MMPRHTNKGKVDHGGCSVVDGSSDRDGDEAGGRSTATLSATEEQYQPAFLGLDTLTIPSGGQLGASTANRSSFRSTFEGPDDETNWLIPGRLLCGKAPSVDDVWRENGWCPAATEWLAIPTHFVNLGGPECFRYADHAAAAAEAAGRPEAPKFAHHTIQEFTPGGEWICIQAVAAVLAGLAAAERSRIVVDTTQPLSGTSCVYLHCRAGHGRTGLIAAIVLGVAYPKMPLDKVLAFVQQAHDSRRDSWDEWSSPETESQVLFAKHMITKLRQGPVPPDLKPYMVAT